VGGGGWVGGGVGGYRQGQIDVSPSATQCVKVGLEASCNVLRAGQTAHCAHPGPVCVCVCWGPPRGGGGGEGSSTDRGDRCVTICVKVGLSAGPNAEGRARRVGGGWQAEATSQHSVTTRGRLAC
jgi:hypothetical protein